MNGRGMGYTTVECIIVISIISILVLIAVPSVIASTDNWILESAAQEIVYAIRETQQLAIFNSKHYNFEINLVDKSFRVRPQEPFTPPERTAVIDSRIRKISSTLQESGGFHNRVLSYSPTGIPGRTGNIVLETKSSKKITITIAVGTGRVRIIK